MSDRPEILEALDPAVRALEDLGVPYRIGGSVASSLHGIARTTVDVDLVVEMRAGQGVSLVRELGDSWYADAPAIEEAIRRGSSFNLIHLPTMLKLDVFIRADTSYARESFARSVKHRIDPEQGAVTFHFTTAEDVILQKLHWFDQGGRASERQWKDVIGVIAARGDDLDWVYLGKWAADLGVDALLDDARTQAGG